MCNTVQIDDSDFKSKLNAFDEVARQNILMSAMSAGATVLQDATRANMQTSYFKTTDKMLKGVHVIKDKPYLTVVVSIMKYYMNKWFETGTVERFRYVKYVDKKGRTRRKRDAQNQLEKAGYTGTVRGTHYFANAQSANEGAITAAIDERFNAELNKYIQQ